MIWICISLIALGYIGIVFYLIEKIKSYSVKSVLIKTGISLLFVIVAIYSAYVKHGNAINPFIIIGLILGLTGDVWLDLKYVYPQNDKIYTYAGFTVFGLGHVFYITGMHLQFLGDGNVLYVIIPLLAGVLAGFVVLLMGKPLKLDYRDMKVIVVAYAALLFSLPATAFGLSLLHHWENTTLIMLLVGGVLFATSDLILSNTYFGEGHEKPLDFVLNYLTYYSAQFVIAFSLFFL